MSHVELERKMATTKRAWVSENGKVALAHGTKIRMRYGKQMIAGEIRDGEWTINGKVFPSPSTAASANARTSMGRRTRLNGWIYWEVFLPAVRQWVKLDFLR